jgi:hypothetical protein
MTIMRQMENPTKIMDNATNTKKNDGRKSMQSSLQRSARSAVP